MPVSPVWILEKANITVSGAGSLDGITQGSGAHLLNRTITLNSNAWLQTAVNDNDANFDDNDSGQTLFGAQRINGVTYASGTVVEAEYSLILTNPATGQTWRVIGYNVNNSNPSYATIEGLAFVGPVSGWPPVGVALRVTSAAEGPGGGSAPTAFASYVTPACFTPGTRIATPDGPRAIERLCPGDLVNTMGYGPQPLLFLASTHVPFDRLLREPHLCPVRIPKGAFGPARPDRDMILSPQHRMIVRGARCQLYFGTPEVLVAAKDLPQSQAVSMDDLAGGVIYLHLAFATHQIVLSDGVESESFLIGPEVFAGAPHAVQDELRALFPGIFRPSGPSWPTSAHPSLRRWEARLLSA